MKAYGIYHISRNVWFKHVNGTDVMHFPTCDQAMEYIEVQLDNPDLHWVVRQWNGEPGSLRHAKTTIDKWMAQMRIKDAVVPDRLTIPLVKLYREAYNLGMQHATQRGEARSS